MPHSSRRASATLLLLLLIPPAAFAQEDPHAHHLMAAQVGWVEREVLERPVPLRPGIGVLHDPATTASAEAQKFYDQGLAYLHSYVWIEAARSFHQALRHDPRLALAHWGLSRTYSGLEDPEAARRAWERATELAAGASERERRRIAARGVQLEAIAEPASVEKHAAYKKALDAALAIDFADPELWLLRGNAEEPTALGRGQRGSAASVAFYERALKLVPDHFPAHHYLVHSYETIGRIEDALRHGEVFARLAPEIPHAQHMYGHDLRRVGRMQEAIARFEETDRLERAYYASEGIAAEADWHHAHNLDLLATCYQHLGQMRRAEDLMRESWALEPATDTLEFNKKEWPAFLLGRGRAEEALAAARDTRSWRWTGPPRRRPSWPPPSASWRPCRRFRWVSPRAARRSNPTSRACGARFCCARATARRRGRSSKEWRGRRAPSTGPTHGSRRSSVSRRWRVWPARRAITSSPRRWRAISSSTIRRTPAPITPQRWWPSSAAMRPGRSASWPRSSGCGATPIRIYPSSSPRAASWRSSPAPDRFAARTGLPESW
jgi:tetratricopeptide (TPR) repeat protein